ncbi:hypothetical protein H5410_047033 [Solanum commersonii]|uniref:Uncharacterized protein n=1 Tax=Solanum commersonii TaxID=4109 RepID=A0A9J5XG32_SOLCO|nr:hypothetical protein H5410_047033 [Solanum commersonii]
MRHRTRRTLEHKNNNPDKAKDGKGDRDIPTNRRMTNQKADLSMKKAFDAMGGMSEDEKVENQSLLAIEQTDKYDFLGLVAITELGEKENSCQT